jgi:hypothetical protein
VTRVNGLLAHAAAAFRRIAAERANREVRAEYNVRVERETEAQMEPTLETNAEHDLEIEL